MRRAATFLLLVPCASIALYAGACSDHHHAESPTLADVRYDPHEGTNPYEPANGGPTDEALQALLALTPVEDPTRAARFTAPVDGAVLPADPPATFTWEVGAPTGANEADVNGDPSFDPLPAPARVAPVRLQDLLGPERAAFAHKTPFDGVAYFVVFTTPSNDKLLRLFSSKTSYTPDADAWATLVSAGAPITASIITGRFTNNTIDADGGPFRGPTVTFTIR